MNQFDLFDSRTKKSFLDREEHLKQMALQCKVKRSIQPEEVSEMHGIVQQLVPTLTNQSIKLQLMKSELTEGCSLD